MIQIELGYLHWILRKKLIRKEVSTQRFGQIDQKL